MIDIFVKIMGFKSVVIFQIGYINNKLSILVLLKFLHEIRALDCFYFLR